MEWDRSDPERIRKLELALENCLMLAARKRVSRTTFDSNGNPIGKTGPKSEDADWDHIVRFCHEAGVKHSILRAN